MSRFYFQKSVKDKMSVMVVPGTQTLVVDIGVPDICVTTPPRPAPAPWSAVIGR